MHIKQARESLGLTQSQLAARLGCKNHYINRAENDELDDTTFVTVYLTQELARTTERWFKMKKTWLRKDELASVLSRISNDKKITVSVDGNDVFVRDYGNVSKPEDVGSFFKCGADDIFGEL